MHFTVLRVLHDMQVGKSDGTLLLMMYACFYRVLILWVGGAKLFHCYGLLQVSFPRLRLKRPFLLLLVGTSATATLLVVEIQITAIIASHSIISFILITLVMTGRSEGG